MARAATALKSTNVRAAKPGANPQQVKRPDPTASTYRDLQSAYDFFNARLFEGKLPFCLLTLQRHKGSYGYFAPGRFASRDGKHNTDEVALNPSHFKERTDKETLSTLVHEQAHVWQAHFGKPPSGVYHNKEWAAKMKELGLYPSTTGKPGGKETGRQCSHYITKGGPFDVACDEFLGKTGAALYVEAWNEGETERKKRETKNASKTKYTCPGCECNAWAKPGANLICGDCSEDMEPAT
ncbi:SprT-like domain-containing protein [Bradyrhizobium liaoningense]|uniref:SprT-like domain-containing protein n=1 Tax=Bradyrhizobium liaoningense TaxID=43992 RepID=UPI001BA903CC|nr:SprT-like domain-containing protein [Bradyrhizobium liaoningense]MBR0876935.1 SprT-like domain-containing protein [Bradyrhizobium liaoningense]